MGLLGSPEPIAALNRVKIREYALPWQEREPLVDIRPQNLGVVLTENVCPYLRQTVVTMLQRAQESLPAGYTLRVGTMLRTKTMQKRGWDRYFERMKEEHPHWPLSALRRATNRYFAPYDQFAPPGHCTGGAVDVALLGPDGEPLNLIAPTEGWEAAYTWSDKISPEAKANRMRMVNAMLEAGFSNCRDEYWHYSWGDSAWAVRVGERECPYGWVHPPVRLETDFPEASATALQMETLQGPPNGAAIQARISCALPPDAEVLCVGLYWANEVPVSLQIHCPRPRTSEEMPLYQSEDRKTWEPVPAIQRKGDLLRGEFTPHADRLYLSTSPPPPAPEE